LTQKQKCQAVLIKTRPVTFSHDRGNLQQLTFYPKVYAKK